MDEHFRILELAAACHLPKEIDASSELSVDVVEELVEEGYLKAVDTSSLEGLEYSNPKITMPGREYLSKLQSDFHSSTEPTDNSGIRVFISHSSKDSRLTESLVELLRAALNLPASQIRCTSVDDHRLPAGVNTEEQLKREVHDAAILLGIISQESVQSSYVMFELGARWGAGRPLIPVLAPGVGPGILKDPLRGLNALDLGNKSQLHQLVTDLGRELDIQPESAAVYGSKIQAVLNCRTAGLKQGEATKPARKTQQLADEEVKVLRAIADRDDYTLTASDIARDTGQNPIRTEYCIDRLLKREMLHDRLFVGAPSTYGLIENGRAYLVEDGLV